MLTTTLLTSLLAGASPAVHADLGVSHLPGAEPAPRALASTQEKAQAFFYARPGNRGLSLVSQEAHDLLLQSLTTQFGEKEPVPAEVAMRLRSRFDAAIVEEPQALEGIGDALRRRFVALEGSLQVVDPASVNEEEGSWQGFDIKLESPLVGTSVVFVPAEKQPDGYGRHFDATALRETVLPKLAAPGDWGLFLPQANDQGERLAALGDEWSIDPLALEGIIAPGGFLGWKKPRKSKVEEKPADTNDAQILRAFAGGVGGNLQQAFDGEVNGTAKARLATVGVDQDQGRYGQIEITFDISMRADRGEFLQSRKIEGEGEMDIDILGGELVVRLQGTAAISWGLDIGRPLEAVARAQETLTMSVRVLPESGETVTQTMSMGGEVVNLISFKEVAATSTRRTVVPK